MKALVLAYSISTYLVDLLLAMIGGQNVRKTGTMNGYGLPLTGKTRGRIGRWELATASPNLLSCLAIKSIFQTSS